ncbi:MAG: family 20 glycosylhydrolase [Acholeplasmatales bacterium]|jgi:hexosaminidase|nr:family 20 glycosylhydrolase [Acholeplasmatales bacterium]
MIPAILQVKEKKNKYLTLKNFNLINSNFTIDSYSVFLERSGLQIDPNSKLKIELIEDHNLRDEEYHIDIDDNITITSKDNRGVILAFTTIYNLFLESSTIKCREIVDYPFKRHRGFMLDCARHFFSKEIVMSIIEEMSLLKLNKFHWHLSDDQGFRIKLDKYLNLVDDNNFYSKDDIKEVVDFALRRGIDIIPEIDIPGHTTAILANLEGLSCVDTKLSVGVLPGIYGNALCIGNEFTYLFLDNLFKELASVFIYPYIHIGGDEVITSNWESCEKCRKVSKENNLKSNHELQGYFNKKVRLIAAQYGKKIIIWNDSYSLQDSSFDGIVQYWQSSHNNKDFKKYKSGNKEIINSDYFHFYYDFPSFFGGLKRTYKYKSNYKNIVGFEACLWTERVLNHEMILEKLFPRIYALGEKNWSFKLNYHKFIKEIQKVSLVRLEKGFDINLKYLDKKNKKEYLRNHFKELSKMEYVKTTFETKFGFLNSLKFFIYYIGFKGLIIINKLKKEEKNGKN